MKDPMSLKLKWKSKVVTVKSLIQEIRNCELENLNLEYKNSEEGGDSDIPIFKPSIFQFLS